MRASGRSFVLLAVDIRNPESRSFFENLWYANCNGLRDVLVTCALRHQRTHGYIPPLLCKAISLILVSVSVLLRSYC